MEMNKKNNKKFNKKKKKRSTRKIIIQINQNSIMYYFIQNSKFYIENEVYLITVTYLKLRIQIM